jgi:hypothetical protein
MSSAFPLRRAMCAALCLCLLLVDTPAPGPAAASASGAEATAALEPVAATLGTAQALDCTPGFQDVVDRVDLSLHGVALTGPNTAVAVGYARRNTPGRSGIRVPASIVYRNGRWTRLPTRGPGDEDGLMAVASARRTATWSVGFTTIDGELKPLAMRLTGKGWTVDRPRVPGAVALFTNVALVSGGHPFAVGYRMASNGLRKPLVLRKDGPRWRSIPIRVPARQSLALLGVASDGGGGVWVTGHGATRDGSHAAIYRRTGGRWLKQHLPSLKGETVLTDVVAAGPRRSWAVGYQRRDGQGEALVLRWNGRTWKKAKAPALDSRDVMLNGVSVDHSGRIWVVGAAWDDATADYQALAAVWDGHAWREVFGPAGGNELHDTIGSLERAGWAVGRAEEYGRATRVCPAPTSGSISGAGASNADPVTDPAASSPDPLAGSEADTGDASTVDQVIDDDDPADTTASSTAKTGSGRSRSRSSRLKRIRFRTGTLPKAKVDAHLVARDVAQQAGIYEETGTYNAVVADFDGDGVDDLFIGRHGRVGRLVLNRNGVFVDHPVPALGAIDRHGCAAADVDGSGLPDLYCAVGGKRGSGLKSNELVLDPGGAGGPVATEVAMQRGVADPTGRGRLTAFLTARRQKAVDLVVTNAPTRVDGLPSLSQVFRTPGNGKFHARGRPGIPVNTGARALGTADYDRDGREDLLLVTGGPQAPDPGRTRLFRNTARGLVEVTRKMGIRAIDDMDAELVDLNRDGKLDLVQLSEDRLLVSLQVHGRFRKVYERRLTDGHALASGDVNGDRRGDLYIVRDGNGHNRPDVMLVNLGNGRAWKSIVIPQATTGAGEDAYAIDYDGNGLDDFLVLNGHNARGPIQLIAFDRR